MRSSPVHDLTAESAARAYAEAPEYNRRKADKYLFVVNAVQGMNSREKEAWCKAWSEEHPDDPIALSTLWKILRRYKNGGVEGCIGKFHGNGKPSIVPDDAFEFFKSLYLNENRIAATACWRLTRAKYANRDQGPGTGDQEGGDQDEPAAQPVKARTFPKAFDVPEQRAERAYVYQGKKATMIIIGGEPVKLTPGGIVLLTTDDDPVALALQETGMLTRRGGRQKAKGR